MPPTSETATPEADYELETSEIESESLDASEPSESLDTAGGSSSEAASISTKPKRWPWGRIVAYALLPAAALLLAAAAGYLKWQDSSLRAADAARPISVQAAKDGTVAMLSYKPDSVEQDLGAARDRLTGDFLNSYTSLIHDVVIPGAKQQHISATANVPAAASVSASDKHAVVMVFVNQTAVVGTGAPSATASTVRVTLDKVGDHWLIAGFDPI